MDSFPNVIPLLQTLPPNSPHTRKINIYVYPDLIYKFLDPHQRISREFVEIDYLLAQNTKGNADEVVLQIVATQIDKALFARKEWCWSRYFLQEVFPLLDSQSRVKCVSSVLNRNDPVMNPRSRFCFDRQSEREMELSRQIEWMIATSCERLYGLS